MADQPSIILKAALQQQKQSLYLAHAQLNAMDGTIFINILIQIANVNVR